VRALIVDDHPLARRGLTVILRENLGITDIREEDTGAQALTTAAAYRPDIIMLDLQMPGSLPARDLCAHLTAVVPDAAIILVTAFDHIDEIRDCLAAGAGGCLLKDVHEIDFAASVRRILSGQRVIDPRISEKIALQLVGGLNGTKGSPRLTARERDVLNLLAAGCSNRQIADTLTLSEATVKGYVSSVLAKLGASSRLEAVVRATRCGLL
jgi:two-component system nitrate/nitrite response regulator NarL